jgi:hypothetical protein
VVAMGSVLEAVVRSSQIPPDGDSTLLFSVGIEPMTPNNDCFMGLQHAIRGSVTSDNQRASSCSTSPSSQPNS